MEKGTPYEGRFARTRFTLPQLSSFARLCPALFFCTGLAIVPVPAAAQMIGFGGFGIGGGLGLPGLMHHGFGGGYGTGRGSGPPGFMSHGGPGFAGRGFRGGPPWGQHSGQSQLRQQSPLGADGGGRRNYGHWPSHGQPSQVGTREFPARRNCGGGPCRPTDSPWRGQGHPSKVGTTEVPPGRRAVAVVGTKTGRAVPQGAVVGTKTGQAASPSHGYGAGGGTTTSQGAFAVGEGAGGVTKTGRGGTTSTAVGMPPKPPPPQTPKPPTNPTQPAGTTGPVGQGQLPCGGGGGGFLSVPPAITNGPTITSAPKRLVAKAQPPCGIPSPLPSPDPYPLPVPVQPGIAVLPYPVLVPPTVIPNPNLPPRSPPPDNSGNQAGPPSPQAPKPPTNQHAAPPPPTEPPQIARVSGPRPSGVPPKDEHRYVPDEVLFEVRAGISPQTIDEIARRQRLQRLASQSLELIGTTLYRYKIKDKRSVPTVVAALERDARIATVQPNYLYRLQGGQNGRFAEAQYAVPEMHLIEAHTISNGEKTLIAVIDSGIDSTHPEFSGAITESFDAIDGGNGEKAMPGNLAEGTVHGTEVAGIIASHAALTGVAPQAHILAVRAFAKGSGRTAVFGTTYDLLIGTDWAVQHKARVVNMSFAGPPDPYLSRAVSAGTRRRVIFIAAVGNEGKAAKPSYPAAYENVIPVTATDRTDAIFKDASRCTTTCVAAPGVDIFAAAPAGAYRYDSGTSMAAAQVTGVVALLLDAKPDLDPKTVRDLLVQTAKHLSPDDLDGSSIAGIVDAYAMLEAAAAPVPLGENAAPIIEQRSAGPSELYRSPSRQRCGISAEPAAG